MYLKAKQKIEKSMCLIYLNKIDNIKIFVSYTNLNILKQRLINHTKGCSKAALVSPTTECEGVYVLSIFFYLMSCESIPCHSQTHGSVCGTPELKGSPLGGLTLQWDGKTNEVGLSPL